MPSGAVPDTGETRGLPQLPVHPLRRPATVPGNLPGPGEGLYRPDLRPVRGGTGDHPRRLRAFDQGQLEAARGKRRGRLPPAVRPQALPGIPEYPRHRSGVAQAPRSRRGAGQRPRADHQRPAVHRTADRLLEPVVPGSAQAVHRRQVRTPGGTLRAGAGRGHRPHQQKPVHLSQPGDQRHPRPEHPLVLPDRRR